MCSSPSEGMEEGSSGVEEKKLVLVLDLDHTLLHSTYLGELSPDEEYLLRSPVAGFHLLGKDQLITKLRPFVHTFLEEASKMFQLYIYTMGDRSYAMAVAGILDPGEVYFKHRVIAREHCNRQDQKSLDVVPGDESTTVILDDTESVWQSHQRNLIAMEKYEFFGSSSPQCGVQRKSPSQLKIVDEDERSSALATILDVLRCVHRMVFDPIVTGTDVSNDTSRRDDVRNVLEKLRREVLQGCQIAFASMSAGGDKLQQIWRMAEQMGATCTMDVNQASVTHVVVMDGGGSKPNGAMQHDNKFLVSPGWIRAAYFKWQRQREEEFLVAHPSPSTPSGTVAAGWACTDVGQPVGRIRS